MFFVWQTQSGTENWSQTWFVATQQLLEAICCQLRCMLQVSETDLYLLGAIEKLVYRVDLMEKRLRRTEELIYHVMEGASTQRQGNYC